VCRREEEVQDGLRLEAALVVSYSKKIL